MRLILKARFSQNNQSKIQQCPMSADPSKCHQKTAVKKSKSIKKSLQPSKSRKSPSPSSPLALAESSSSWDLNPRCPGECPDTGCSWVVGTEASSELCFIARYGGLCTRMLLASNSVQIRMLSSQKWWKSSRKKPEA